jgi:hypothetical protein
VAGGSASAAVIEPAGWFVVPRRNSNSHQFFVVLPPRPTGAVSIEFTLERSAEFETAKLLRLRVERQIPS